MDDASRAPLNEEDELWLGRIADRFLAAIAEGREPDVAAACAERPDLAPAIEDFALLSQTIAPRRPARRPSIAGYSIVGELGHGGMGSVFVAEHARLGRRVALKLLPARFAAASKARERFEREARAIARLDHERIVQVYEVGEDDGTPYYAMELVDGRTLAAAIGALQERAEPPAHLTASDLARAAGCERELDKSYARSVARIGLDVARALEHAHAHGVVHRDLKPSNVMLRRDGRAQLFDFGLASVESEASLTQTGHFLGTPHYASPEQASGTREIDARSDLYSLGVTLYELATLERPFRAASSTEVLRRVQREEPSRVRALNRSIPSALETIVSTAMAKEPGRRYLSATALAADLEAFLGGWPIAAKPTGALTRFALRVKRHPLPAALVTALVAAPTLLFLQQRAANGVVRAARDEAEELLSVADARDAYMSDVFSAPSPKASGRDVRVVDVLARAEAALAERFADRPAVRAALASTIARTYDGLGLTEDAQRARGLELEALRAQFGPGSTQVLSLAAQRCQAQLFTEPEAALSEIEASIAAATDSVAPTDPAAIAAEEAHCAALYQLGRFDEMLERSEQLVARLEPLPERDPADWFRARDLRTSALLGLGRAAEAAESEAAVLRESVEVFGQRSPLTLEFAQVHVQALAKLGRFDEALREIEPYSAIAEDLFGEGHRRFLEHLHMLAALFVDAGDLDTAEMVQSRSMELAERYLAGRGWICARIRLQAAAIAALRGDLAEAQRILLAAREAAREEGGDPRVEAEIEKDLASLRNIERGTAEFRGPR